MAIYSMVAFAMPYILLLLGAEKKLIAFWIRFSSFLSGVFNPRMPQDDIPRLQAVYGEIIADVSELSLSLWCAATMTFDFLQAKILFPNLVANRDPNNVHAVLEILHSDLPVFGNGMSPLQLIDWLAFTAIHIDMMAESYPFLSPPQRLLSVPTPRSTGTPPSSRRYISQTSGTKPSGPCSLSITQSPSCGIFSTVGATRMAACGGFSIRLSRQ